MSHPKIPHVIFLPAQLFPKNQKLLQDCVRAVIEKTGKKGKCPVKGRRQLLTWALFFWKLKKLGAGKAERLLEIQQTAPSAPRIEDN